MFSLTKIVHVLAVGLWFGATVFFTFVVGLSLFDTFEKETVVPAAERPFWLPLPPEFEPRPNKQFPERLSEMFPHQLGKEQGNRIAGTAVGPIFRPYFILQLACGLLAGLSALAWFALGRIHKVRTIVLLLALAGAGAGWWLEREVDSLREERSRTSDVVLKNKSSTSEEKSAADAARTKFGEWHDYSLIANLSTVALVTTAMILTAFLPGKPAKE